MCQNKSSNSNNVYQLTIVERQQKIMSTYSRTIKARRSPYTLNTAAVASPDPTNFTASNDRTASKISTGFPYGQSHSQINNNNNSQINCDYFRSENKQSDLCDKKITTFNMDQSSCILTSSRGQFHCNNRMPNTQTSQNAQPNTQHNSMINGTHNTHVHRHRTAKSMGNTSKFRGNINEFNRHQKKVDINYYTFRQQKIKMKQWFIIQLKSEIKKNKSLIRIRMSRK